MVLIINIYNMTQNNLHPTEYGYTPPQAVDIEEAILGALLLEGKEIENISTLITEDYFYKPQHQIIFRAILNIHELGFVPDMLTVTQELRDQVTLAEIGGAGYIAQLSNSISSALELNTHIRILTEKYIQRQFILITEKSLRDGRKGGNPYKIYKELSEKYDKLFTIEDESKQFKHIIDETIEDLKGIMEGLVRSRLYSRTKFDEIIDVSRDETIWVAALAKHGKTKMVIQFMSQLLKHNEDIGVKWFSMEDPDLKIVRHFGAIETNIQISKMERKDENIYLNKEEFENISEKLENIKKYDISIEYGSKPTEFVTTQTLSFVKKRKQKHNIIIIDNFNILVGNVEGRMTDVQKENYVVEKLQKLRTKTNQKGFNTTFIVLDHLNKEIFKNGLENGFRPSEGLLKGSSRKQEAMTQMIFINKIERHPLLMDEYKGLPKVKFRGVDTDISEIMEKLILYEAILTRNGGIKLGSPIRYIADLDTMKFEDFEELKNEKPKDREYPQPEEVQIFDNKEETNTNEEEEESDYPF